MSAWDLKLRPDAGDGPLIVVFVICLLVVFWRQGAAPPQNNLSDLADGSYLLINQSNENELVFISKFSGTHIPPATPHLETPHSTARKLSVSFAKNTGCSSAQGTLEVGATTAVFSTVTGERNCQLIQLSRLGTPYQILSRDK